MKWLKSRKPTTEANRKLVPYLHMLAAGFCGGVSVHFIIELIHAVFAQSWYGTLPNAVVSGSMAVIALIVMVLLIHRWARHPDVIGPLQQAKDEKKAQLEATL